MWLYFPAKNLSHSEGNWLCDYTFQPKIYPLLRGPDYVIIISSQKSIPFWGNWLCDYTFQPKIYPILRGLTMWLYFPVQKSIIYPILRNLTMWLYFPVKNLSHSEGNWLCDYTFQPKIYPILRGPDYVIILPAKNLSHSEGNLTMWLYFPVKNLSHSEGTWLCDYTFQSKIYPILRGPDYVIILSSQKSIPFWGELTMWLYFPVKNLSHSEGTWLCDYTFQPKIYPILRGPDYVIITFQPKIYPILRGPDYVIILSSQKSIPFWGDLTMWLYFPVKNLSHSEGTWLCDHNFQPKIYPILRGPDYVIILSSQKSIPFWGDWLCDYTFQPKIYPILRGTWLCDYTFQSKIYPILRGPDYVIILSSQKSIPFWRDLTMWS